MFRIDILNVLKKVDTFVKSDKYIIYLSLYTIFILMNDEYCDEKCPASTWKREGIYVYF